MPRLSPLWRAALSTSAFGLLLKLMSLLLSSRLAAALGAEGMGVLQLGLSVEALAVTLATSGVRFSVTRLGAEELGAGGRASSVLPAALGYALGFSTFTALLLALLAPRAAALAGDGRLTLALRCFAPGLPFLAVCAVFSGYFTAVFRPWKASLSQVAEQGLTLGLTLLLLSRLPRERPDLCCAAFALASAMADAGAALLCWVLYRREAPSPAPAPRGMGARLWKLSLPLALSTYARTALSTLRHLLVPRMLRRSGATAAESLSVYGVVSGMVFPVLGFASLFFTALAEQLIPALTLSGIRGDRRGTERLLGRVLGACLALSSAVSLLLFLAGPWLGRALYRSAEAGVYLRALAPLGVVMVLDSVVDGMLKGLGMHLSSMVINVLDALASLGFVCLLLPRFGVKAYIALLYLSECANFLLSYLCLRRRMTIKIL